MCSGVASAATRATRPRAKDDGYAAAHGPQRRVAGMRRRRRTAPNRYRAGHRRHCVARGPGARSLAVDSVIRRQRRTAALPAGVPSRPARRSPTGLRHPRGDLLPSRCLAGRRVPGRSRGLLLPTSLRHHQPGAPVGRPRAGRRGHLLAATRPRGQAQHHRSVAGRRVVRPRMESRRSVAAGAHRHHWTGAHRSLPGAVSRRQRRARAPPCACPPRQRRAAFCADHHVGRWCRGCPAGPSAGAGQQRDHLEPGHRPAPAVVAVVVGRATVDRSTGRGGGRRGLQRPARGAHGVARDCTGRLGVLGERRAVVRKGRQPGSYCSGPVVGFGRGSAPRHRSGPRGRPGPGSGEGPHRPSRAVPGRRRAWHLGVAGPSAARWPCPLGSSASGRAGTGGRRSARPPSFDRGVVRSRHARTTLRRPTAALVEPHDLGSLGEACVREGRRDPPCHRPQWCHAAPAAAGRH